MIGVRQILFALLSVFSCWIFAAQPADELLAKLNHINTLQAHFQQVVRDEQGIIIQQAQGLMKLSRPKLFYWQIDEPSNQIIIADGKHTWTYDKDLEQVVKRNQKDQDNLPAQLLSGDVSRLTQDFSVEKKAKSPQSLPEFDLSAKDKDSAFLSIVLGFNGDALASMSVVDGLGHTTVFQFDQVQLNQSIPASTYRFTPPQGVDVIEG